MIKGPLGIPLPAPTKGIVAEQFFPLAEDENKYITNKQFEKEQKLKKGGAGKTSHDEKEEWLSGVKTAHTRKKDKRVKSLSSTKSAWLGE
jgi:hypothetical protein